MKNTLGRYSTLGRLIAQGRKAVGLQQGELAAAMRVSQQSVSRWEAGTSRPRAREIVHETSFAEAKRRCLDLLTQDGAQPENGGADER